ncbi:hypothetical protein KGP36_08240, partial [Patescibacteria group bacterium]|nr:hypothetical protein [Patescibacteria group bacterium]
MPSLYKVLGADGRSIHGGNAVWHLPSGGRPGKWMPAVAGPSTACGTGYHLAEIAELLNWIQRDCRIYSSEGRGDSDRVGTTIAYRQARLLRR